eukprot:166130_1
MILPIFIFATCVYFIEGLQTDFSSLSDAEKYVSEFIVYEDHLEGGNVNENFEFIQKYISKDFVYCFGDECTNGREEYIQSLNSLNRIVKDWTLTADVRNYGRRYISLYTLRVTTFENGETFTTPSETTLILNEDGRLKYWINIPNNQKYIDQFKNIIERNAGVQKKDDL